MKNQYYCFKKLYGYFNDHNFLIDLSDDDNDLERIDGALIHIEEGQIVTIELSKSKIGKSELTVVNLWFKAKDGNQFFESFYGETKYNFIPYDEWRDNKINQILNENTEI